ncbi:hypothetical protein AAMO2058_001367300 [Amorphochlora amoebiformis]
MATFRLILPLLLLNSNAIDLPHPSCPTVCKFLALGSSLGLSGISSCEIACAERLTSGISPGCLDALKEWLGDTEDVFKGEPKAIEAAFSSTNIPVDILTIAESGIQLAVKKNLMGGFLGLGNTFLKDYGKYDACQEIQGAHICFTKFTLGETLFSKYGPFGTCLPNTCSADDANWIWEESVSIITMAINASSLPAQEKNVIVSTIQRTFSGLTEKSHCGNVTYGWTTGGYVMTVILSTLGFLVVIATLTTYFHRAQWIRNITFYGDDRDIEGRDEMMNNKPKGKVIQGLECFSLYNTFGNFSTLRPRNGTAILDGLRVFSMMWIIFGHSMAWPLMFSDHKHILILVSAKFAVDTFYWISGFLASYVAVSKFKNKSAASVIISSPYMYLNRYLRIVPVYMLILWFYVEVLPMLHNGPFVSVDTERSFCRDKWWRYVLLIQTLWPKEAPNCFIVSWYLANDFMFFLFFPPMLAIYKFNKKLGYIIPFMGAMASIIYAYYEAGKDKWRIGQFDGSDYPSGYNYPPWTRFPVYVVGILFGYLYRDYKRYKDVQQQDPLGNQGSGKRLLVDAALLAFSLFLFGSTVYGIYQDAQSVPGTMSNYENYAYIALTKPAWAIGLCCFCFVMFEGGGGAIEWFLSREFFGYISKLTFCMYLIHPLILSLYFCNMVQSVRFTVFNYAVAFLGILFATAVVSFVVTLFAELPLSNFQGFLLRPKKQRKPNPAS